MTQLAIGTVDRQVDVGARRRGHGRAPTERLAPLGLPVVAHVAGRGDRRRGSHQGRQHELEIAWHVAQRHAILRAPGPGEAGFDGRQVEGESVGIRGLGARARVEQALLLHVGLDELHLLLGAAREFEVADRLLVDREDAHGRPVLGRHVADGGPIGDGQGGDPRAVELHELPDHALLPEHFGHGEHQVGRGRALGELPGEPEPDDLRDQHRHRLAQHGGLGLDTADAPSQHAEAVDHRRVRVGSDQGVGVRLRLAVLAREDDARQILEVHLVDDPRVGGDHPEAAEGLLRPTQ